MSSVRLPRAIVNRILSHAQHAPETEVCGLIAGRGGEPVRVCPVPNVAREPERLFEMAPEGQIDAMRRMRENGETLFAIYHSHPHAPAVPSAQDLEQAAYPEALHLIVSLDTKGVLQLSGFRLDGGAVQPLELEVV